MGFSDVGVFRKYWFANKKGPFIIQSLLSLR